MLLPPLTESATTLESNPPNANGSQRNNSRERGFWPQQYASRRFSRLPIEHKPGGGNRLVAHYLPLLIGRNDALSPVYSGFLKVIYSLVARPVGHSTNVQTDWCHAIGHGDRERFDQWAGVLQANAGDFGVFGGCRCRLARAGASRAELGWDGIRLARRYKALRSERTAGRTEAIRSSRRCQARGAPGVRLPRTRGSSVPEMAMWLLGT